MTDKFFPPTKENVMRNKKSLASVVAALALFMFAIPSVNAGAPGKGGTVVYLSSKIPSLNPLHSAYEVGLVTSQIFAALQEWTRTMK